MLYLIKKKTFLTRIEASLFCVTGINCWAQKFPTDLNWMENFKTKDIYLKLCYEFSAFIRCMKAAFYIPDYQKFLVCPLIQRLGRAFVSKHAVDPLKRSAELLKHSTRFLRAHEKTKSSAKSLKSLTECLCYNTDHAVSISQIKIGTLKWLSLLVYFNLKP